MKIVVSWLRELCPTEMPADELAERLTSQGVKVEAIVRPWERLSGVVVARVLEVRDHPNADKLCLARVSTGSGEREVVVGVRNMAPGDLVPLAGPGATVPGLPEPLGAQEIRGVISDGMMCSPKELAISGDHTGILILPPDAPVGADFRSAFGLDDSVLDIEVKSNRPDLLSVIGVAREAASATGTPLTLPDTSVPEGDEKAADVATVEVLDLERCPRYLARVIRGVSLAPSPLRVQARLTASGMRPLSNVVDATNYVMLEMGQPLHPFDLAVLSGSGVVVRRAEEGERLVTLDDAERVLTAEDLLIADHARAVAIAGVMGTAPAEVSPSTADVLLESAHFEPKGVLRTSRRLGLQTEASVRFGRGADPEAVEPAADLAAKLIGEWSGGTVLAGAIDVGTLPERRRLTVRPDRVSIILGYEVSSSDVVEAFSRLGVPTRDGPDGRRVEVEVPSYRWDLLVEEDLIEEVARVQGYDRVPETLPPVRQAGGVHPSHGLRRRVREALVRSGLREGVSYSFASSQDLELMAHHAGQAVRVANPLSADQEFLRTSLVPGLVRSLRTNLSRYVRGVAQFEVGRVFRLGQGEAGSAVLEEERAAIILAGEGSTGYPGETRELDFFDAKGAVEALMAGLSVSPWSLGDSVALPFHPARSAVLVVGDEAAGVIGELHPKVVEVLDLPRRTAVAEVILSALERHMAPAFSLREVPRFPPVRRDLAFLVNEEVPAGAVEEVLREAGGDLVDAVVLFDVFTGDPLPPGKKNLAFSLDFRAPDRTLTDEEAERAVAAIVDRLRRDFGAEFRAG
jgi:phenylalanyl-tRNA synthetase beta chain